MSGLQDYYLRDPVAGWELHPLKINTFPRRTHSLTPNSWSDPELGWLSGSDPLVSIRVRPWLISALRFGSGNWCSPHKGDLRWRILLIAGECVAGVLRAADRSLTRQNTDHHCHDHLTVPGRCQLGRRPNCRGGNVCSGSDDAIELGGLATEVPRRASPTRIRDEFPALTRGLAPQTMSNLLRSKHRQTSHNVTLSRDFAVRVASGEEQLSVVSCQLSVASCQ
jgi:hypothetical protein